jgi:adenylate cyclase
LPFLNISGDDDQEYFSDGITEDIITALSRFQSLNVIARSSTFAYKDKSTKPQEIGQGLNVQYIIEGSVRKGEEHILVTVQLIESETGNQVWAEKYNRLLVDIFELQDELAKAIVGTLVGRIETTNVQRIKRSPPGDLGVYDRLLHAKVLHHRGSREANEQARKLLDEAIEINPEFSSAFFWKSCCISQGVMRGYIEEYENVWDDCLKLTRKGFSIDENDFEVLWGLCEWHMSFGEWDRAKMVHEKAFMLNPNDPRIVAQRGELLTWLGQPNEAVEWVEKVMHLDPYNADNWSHLLGQALFGAQRYKEAVQAFLRVPTPTYGHHAFLAACYAHLGLDNNANIQAVIVLKMKADFSSNEYVTSALFPPLYQKEEDVSHLLDGLHKAGLPE